MPDARPNIVVITAHDTGRHFGCYGLPTVVSPNIDRLAEEGVRFTQCFAASPKCSPSRAAMMTGRWPQSNGVFGLTHSPWLWKYKPGERHLAAVLRDVGYDTRLFHFQHEFLDRRELPFNGLHAMPQDVGPDDGGRPEYFLPAGEVARSFAEFCDQRTDKAPFYAQIGFFETHSPLDFGGNKGDDSRGIGILPNYVENDKTRHFFRMLQGSVRQADAAVGAILDALERNGLKQNTLVLFTVDHGISFARAKGTLYDLGLEVALIMRWPGGGIVGGRESGRFLANIDVFPTVLDLIGAPVPSNCQGVGFAPTARGEPDSPEREYVFGEHHEDMHCRCIRSRRYKLIRHFAGYRPFDVPVDPGQFRYLTGPFVELFDLEKDPLEAKCLSTDPAYTEVRQQLDRRLYDHLREVGDPILDGPVPTPFYLQAAADYRAAVGDAWQA